MRRLLSIAVLLAAVLGCGDNLAPPTGGDDDAAPPEIDASVDAAPTTLGACLDRPTDLQRPPTGMLPCELLPPGLTITP